MFSQTLQKEQLSSFLPFVLALLVTVSVVTSDMYVPSLPHLLEYFKTTPFKIQLTLSVYLIGLSFSMLICAPLADRFGTRRIILSGLFIYFIASMLCLCCSSINYLIIGRFFQSFGGCCGSILTRVIVKDHYPSDTRIKLFSYLFIGMAISVMAAPLVGSMLFLFFGWRANFAYMCIYSVFLFSVAYLVVPNKITTYLPASSVFKKYISLFYIREYVRYTFVITLLWTGFFVFVAKSPFIFISQYGISVEKFGLYYSFIISGLIAGILFTKKYPQGFQRSVRMGISVSLLASLLLFILNLWIGGVFNIVFFSFLYLFGLGIVLPNCQAAVSEICADSGSTAFSMMYFLKMLGGALGGFAVPYISQDFDYSLTFILLLCSVGAYFFSLDMRLTLILLKRTYFSLISANAD